MTSKAGKGTPARDFREKASAMRTLCVGASVFHGLRKNAVNKLLEAGCTRAEMSAIVAMSEQMVRHYSRDVNKRRLAISRMRKLGECRKDTRANLSGPGDAAAAGRGSGTSRPALDTRGRWSQPRFPHHTGLASVFGERAGTRTQDLQIKRLRMAALAALAHVHTKR
jgi:hypothetical protein